MNQKLVSYGINPYFFYNTTPENQRELMLKTMNLENVGAKTRSCPQELSVMVVKPEAFSLSSKIEKYMTERRGFNIIDSQPFVYTREVYYSIYERLFTDWFSKFPHGPLLMLTATSMRSRAILFRHNIAKKNDPQRVLNLIEKDHRESSIRREVTLPAAEKLGFATMNKDLCSGKCFDPSGAFIERSPAENLRTFNGLHIPNNKLELDVTFSLLSTIIESWQTI